MSSLSFDAPGDHVYVHSASADGVRVGERVFTSTVVLARQEIIEDWGPQRLEDISEADFEALLQRRPEMVLLGTGTEQQFLEPQRQAPFYRHQVGVEVMTTQAACRTFNVLALENRDVLAILLPMTGD
ncbi:hypothetical protein F3N42_04435 [Marinihelvus fidelis]|uniref:Xcc1710-like domain-containing protein n=1 Tax=Marinihelvus fidelis TaxID=2613842 RepID=A0A5N0TBZ1_9GAMM|nr:MTH938/NDUFAF3 family protein [Marinihelvus fidelis]KAA9132480.1 hypothetical protein F3N42_04435 [Marinihelvus fidelis]